MLNLNIPESIKVLSFSGLSLGVSTSDVEIVVKIVLIVLSIAYTVIKLCKEILR